MVRIGGDASLMGSDRHYPEEPPAQTVTISPFWADRTPITNRQFREFVNATGYVAVAEIAPDSKDYPGTIAKMLKPGSNRRRPYGRGTSNRGLDDHPVMHVAWRDVEAWGDEFLPRGKHVPNTWWELFPQENLAPDGFSRTSPVGCYTPNDNGLYDIMGNLWELTSDWYTVRSCADAQKSRCIPANQHDTSTENGSSPRGVAATIPCKVVKDGSHLCAPNDCRRYRPAARHAQPVESGMSNVGFRCVARE